MAQKRTATPDRNFEHVLIKTNEEIAAEDAAIRERNQNVPRVEFLRDETDKRVSGFDPWSEIDPMTAALRSIPGGPKYDRAYKLCSNNSATLLGGHMGYEPERDVAGNVITIGNMFVASIPKDVAESRRKLNEYRAKEAISDKEDEYRSNVEDLQRQATDMGFDVKPMSSGDHSQRTRGSRAEEELGIEVIRGTESEAL